MDELYRYTEEPLFICEGLFDAISIGKNAIALLGSNLSEFQVRELRKVSTRRRLIFIIDKNKNGFSLGTMALQNDWEVVCFPKGIEDANDGLVQLGKLWLVRHLTSEAKGSFAGKLLLELNCKGH